MAESLGRYRIVRELGRGAMGRVLLAHDPDIDRHVAIKTIQAIAALPEEDRQGARERVKREARAAGRLVHRGIVTVYDVGETDGIPWLAMEHLEGTPLDAWCAPGPLLPVPVVVELLARAGEALAHAHRQGIVHRDVKPANLMRVGETDVKVMDFGLARNPAVHRTHDDALMGTPSYMAPEQIRGEASDGRADLFSLGVVLYEMLTGRKPFPGDSLSSILYRIVHEDPPDPSLEHERVSPALAAVLRQALAKDPADRFSDGEAFARALRAALPAASARPPARPQAEPPDPEPPPRPPRTGRGTPILAAAALAAVAFVGLWLWKSAQPPEPPMIEATVRTEPAGLPVRLDGAPLTDATVRFPLQGPFGLLTAARSCRTAEHRLSAADAGREIVLVPDPTEAEVILEGGAAGATVSVNGGPALPAPAAVRLDLCRENRVVVAAPGHRPVETVLAAGTTPTQARTIAAAAAPEAIPTGRLKIARPPVPGRLTVDGASVAAGGEIELTEGTHAVRLVSEDLWLDLRQEVTIRAGETSLADWPPPDLADLAVQAFPSNCRVFLRRRPQEPWRYLDDTPLARRVAAGSYQVKVEYAPTGEAREMDVTLRPGRNAPVRAAFGRGSQ